MDAKSKPRRRHSAQFKAEVIAACAEPGASVAAVARRFELNDNLVHQWRRGRGAAVAQTMPLQACALPAEFVALSLPPQRTATTTQTPATPASSECIRIELRRGATTVNVHWPLTAPAECAGWLRELLR